MAKPIAVILSDVHYDLKNLEMADKATNLAVDKANKLKIPLVISGDLHNTKANLRGECVNTMLKTFMRLKVDCYVIIGNHCRIHEKSKEHSLNFLEHLVNIVDEHYYSTSLGIHMLAYNHSAEDLKNQLRAIPKDKILIMHQGLQGSNSGEYFQDPSALNTADLAGRRVILGHYHYRQTIDLPEGGIADYVGNPYTTSFGEANDPPKGFQVLYNDGSLEFIPTDLRQHRVLEVTVNEVNQGLTLFDGADNDIVWVKVTGPSDKLALLTKKFIGEQLDIKQSFKLDLIPLDTEVEVQNDTVTISNPELLDSLIDSLSNTDEDRKARLKALWKEFV